MADVITPCPNCGGNELYMTQTASAGHYGPALLPGLGGWWSAADFSVVVCGGCGLTRFFASLAALEKLPGSDRWIRYDA